MKSDHIELVQGTWKQVLPIREAAAQLFYTRLFERDPSLKPLFRGDMAEQGRRLMAMIGTAVAGLNRPEQLIPAVRELGMRHAGYGVRDEHYDTVAAALLDTLRAGLGDLLTPEAEDAWVDVYGVLASTMKEAARQRTGM